MNIIYALLDQTENSKNFIHYAASLSKDVKANLKVMLVQNPQAYPLGTPDTTGESVVQVQQNLNVIAETVERTVQGYFKEIKEEMKDEISMEFHAEMGVPSLVLENKLKNNKSAMVMLQGHIAESFWNKDSTNMDIIRSVNCPVWIIPEDAKFPPITNIIYMTDYQQEDIPTLEKLVALTRPFSPTITAVHISNDKNFEEKVKSEGFTRMINEKQDFDKVIVETIKDEKNEDTTEVVSEYAKNNDADLIVILKENKNFLERIFAGSFTKKLLKQTNTPVLIYHEQ